MQALGPLRPRGLVLELGICLKQGTGNEWQVPWLIGWLQQLEGAEGGREFQSAV